MRKIRNQRDVDQGRRNRNILIGVVLILLLVVAPIGYSLFSRDDSGVSENAVNEFGFDFYREGGIWKVDVGGDIFGFRYLPSEVANVSISGSYDFGMYSNELLYFVNSNNGASEILNNIGRYVLRYQDACAGNGVSRGNGSQVTGNGTVCGGDWPTKDCGSNLIIFEAGNETRVWQNESCVYIAGDGAKGADAFLYKALKIS